MKITVLARALAATVIAGLATFGVSTSALAAPATNVDYQLSGSTVSVTLTPGTNFLTDFCADYGYPGNTTITPATPGQTAALVVSTPSSYVVLGANDAELTATPGGNTSQLSGPGKGSFQPSTASTPQTFSFSLPTSLAAGTWSYYLACVDTANWIINRTSITQSGTQSYVSNGATNSTVTFNANGGTGAIADQVASAAAPLTANAFSRSGFTFAGWNTAADGTGTAYADGASYDFTASTTLYA